MLYCTRLEQTLKKRLDCITRTALLQCTLDANADELYTVSHLAATNMIPYLAGLHSASLSITASNVPRHTSYVIVD